MSLYEIEVKTLLGTKEKAMELKEPELEKPEEDKKEDVN